MFELVALGALGLAAAIVLGVLFSLGAMLLWCITLPFKILGWVFQGIGVLLALPFLLLFGILGAAVFGFGVLIFLMPAVPLILMVWFAWWLVRRNGRAASSSATSH